MKKIPILIDTDLGDDVDDTAALIMAINSPELEIVGITTVYHDTEKRAQMVKEILRLYGREDIPVYAGRGNGILEKGQEQIAPLQYDAYEHAQGESPSKRMSALQFILEQVQSEPDLIILEMGMMTNLALAFLIDSETMRNSKIIGMGGLFDAPVPEWNIKCDPAGAKIVMDQAMNLTMFGLEVTKYLLMQDQEFLDLCPKENTAMQHFLVGVKTFREKTGFPITLHDVVLVAYLIRPDLAKLVRCDYTTEMTGELTRGAIYKQINGYQIEQENKKNFYYATEIDTKHFFELVKERLH